MAEIFGLGVSHGPIILTPPEIWAQGRERIYNRVPNYEKPAQLLEELGTDNGLSLDIADQKAVMDSFQVMRDRLHQWDPDLVMIIGDDQAENFLQDNLPPFCLYTGAEVSGFPFQRPSARANLWDAAPETEFKFQCPKDFSRDLRNYLIPGLLRHCHFFSLEGLGLGSGPRHHQSAGVPRPRSQVPHPAPFR